MIAAGSGWNRVRRARLQGERARPFQSRRNRSARPRRRSAESGRVPGDRRRAAKVLAAGMAAAIVLAALPSAPQLGIGSLTFGFERKGAPSVEAPGIDWDYWASANPDVVGWIKIPGTSIDGPVAQAPADDPSYYLTHDAHRGESAQGCFYLDADCAEGLASRHCIILGHNMSDGSMFAPLRGYLDASFALQHRTVVIDAPEGARTFEVAAARTVDGGERAKRTSFATAGLLHAWLADQVARSAVVPQPRSSLDPPQALTLVTCTPGGSRRALVLAVRTGS